MEIHAYEIIWYGDGRTITWGSYPTEEVARSHTSTKGAPLQRWRIIKKVYRVDHIETVDEGFGRKSSADV